MTGKLQLGISIGTLLLVFLMGLTNLKAQKDPLLVIYDPSSQLSKTVRVNRANNEKALVQIAVTRAARIYLAAYPFDGELPGNKLSNAVDSTFAQGLRGFVKDKRKYLQTKETGDLRPEIFLVDETFKYLTERGRIHFRTGIKRFDSLGIESPFIVEGQAVLSSIIADNPLGIYFERLTIEEL